MFLVYALRVLRPRRVNKQWFIPWLGVYLLGLGILIIYVSYQFRWSWLSGVGLAIFFAIGLGILEILSVTSKLGRITIWGVGAIILSTIPVFFVQKASNFSEEEFFSVFQVILLSFYIFLMLICSNNFLNLIKPIEFKSSFAVSRLHLSIISVLSVLIGGWYILKSYQGSFYPKVAPLFPGITYEQPFLCEDDSKLTKVISGSEVLKGYKQLIELNPYKGVPEFASLAIIENNQSWAALFRDSLLAEVWKRKYTGPANSIKYDQYYAATRAYYYGRMTRQFPALFSSTEKKEIIDWFHAINKRALTVEWVDWMYATAFKMWPVGPYENQDIGVGLIAILEKEKLADPSLSSKNKQYLESNRRGWDMRFRNTDDTLSYQPLWITNAYFQWLYWNSTNSLFVRRSFEWLLDQALPNGQFPQYNTPTKPILIGPMIFGAYLTDNPSFTWIAAKSIQSLLKEGGYIYAYPGVESITQIINGEQPSIGSCLLYGNSGLPNQQGPLAPDKIVLRSGWNDEDIFIQLNLRFTGWHRYKGTGTITTIYAGNELVTDNLKYRTISWLPAGRSLLRDKRIPIENLNGFLIERSGLDWALNKLIEIGSPWTQDPPFYAIVDDFRTSAEMDYAKVILNNWNGTTLSREVYAFNQGVIGILDRAEGNIPEVIWHLNDSVCYQLNNEQSTTCGKIFFLVYDRSEIKQLPRPDQSGIVKIKLNKGEVLITIVTNVQWREVEFELNESNLVVKNSNKLITIPLH